MNETPRRINANAARAILPRIRGEMRFDLPRARAEVGQPMQRVQTESGTIAVIPVIGTLVKHAGAMDAESGLVSYDWLELELTRALNSPMIDGVLLDIDSPGGEVNGLLDLGDLIREGRSQKPIFAVADDFALSAAYLLASAAERVFLTQTASVGSVGVLALHIDQSARDAQEGLKYTTVFAGARKNDLNPHYPLGDRARKELQRQVDDTNRFLTDAVGKNRARSGESIRRLEAGVFQRQEAIRRGLADEIGNVNDALRELGERIRRGVARSRAAGAFPRVEGRKLESVAELYARRRREARTGRPGPFRA